MKPRFRCDIRTFLWVILAFNLSALLAQQPTYPLYYYDNDLQNLIHARAIKIAKGNDGRLWLGNYEGLNVYDGYNVQSLASINDKGNDLPENRAQNVWQDRQGNMWVAGDRTISKYDYVHRRFEIKLQSQTRKYDNAPFVCTDKNGFFWTNVMGHDSTAYGNCLRYDPVLEKSYPITLINPKTHKKHKDRIEGFSISNEDKAYFGSNGKVYSFVFKEGQALFDLKEELFDNKTIETGFIAAVCQDKNENVWVGTHNGQLLRKQKQGDVFRTITLPMKPTISKDIWEISEYKDNIWVLTRGTIYILSQQAQILEVINAGDVAPQTSNPPTFQSMYHDSSGLHLIATNLFILKYLDQPPIFKFLSLKSIPNLINQYVFPIHVEQNGNIWAGIYNRGVQYINPSGDLIKSFRGIKGTKNQQPNDIFSIFKDSRDNFWVGSLSEYFGILDRKTGVFRKIGETASALQYTNELIRCFAEDKEQNIWYGRRNGVSCYTPTSQRFKHYDLTTENLEEARDNMMFVFFDSKDRLWVGGTQKVLFLFNKVSRQFEGIKLPQIDKNLLSIYEDSLKNQLWIGTEGNGLIQFDIATQSVIRTFTTKQGFSSNVIYSILEDKHRNLWLATTIGMLRFNMDNFDITHFGKTEGVPFDDFNSNAYFKTANGDMYFGGVGIIHFHPDSVLKYHKQLSYPVVLTSFKALGKEVKTDSALYKVKKIELPYTDNFIEIEWTLPDYRLTNKALYSYKLEGFDKDWSVPSNRRHAFYTNLPPGTYQLHIKGTNRDSFFGKNFTSIALIIKPAWWQTVYFKWSILIFCVLFARFAWLYYQQKQTTFQEKQAAELKQLNIESLKAQIAAMRQQINPHFLFNAINNISNFIYRSEQEQADNYLNKLSALLRTILKNTDIHFIYLNEEINYLENYLDLEKMRFSNSFTAQIRVEATIDTEKMQVHPMLIQPLIENSLQHGLLKKAEGEKHIDVYFYENNANLICQVTDTGIGFKSKTNDFESHKSLGLTNIRERIALLSKMYRKKFDFTIQEKKDNQGNILGVEATLTFPQIENNPHESHHN